MSKFRPIITSLNDLDSLKLSANILECEFYGKALELPAYKDTSIYRCYTSDDLREIVQQVTYELYKQLSCQIPHTLFSHTIHYEILSQHAILFFIDPREWDEEIELETNYEENICFDE